MARYCRVAVDSPVGRLDRAFDYRVPERMRGRLGVGSVVRVPLHGRRVRAFVTALPDAPEVAEPRSVSALVSADPLFDAAGVSLARWTADRYLATHGQVLHHAVPGRFSAPPVEGGADRGAASGRRPAWLERPDRLASPASVLVLPPGPEAELEAIAYACAAAAGRVLVIAPGPADAERIGTAVGGAVCHGDQRPADRAAGWARARDGSARVVVGTRAALYVPLPNLGLVWVSGAHDRTLKEERTPRLHGLVVARRRAAQEGAGFVASSGAPPLELWADPEIDVLTTRRSAARGAKPEVAGLRSDPVTPRLLSTLRWALDAGSDSLVLISRKGTALRIRCRDCGWYPRCPDCGLGMGTTADGLRCRGCGRAEAVPTLCASCRGDGLRARGWGHDRLAAALADHDLPVVKVDAQTPLFPGRPSPAVVVGTQAAVRALHGARLGAVVAADLDQMLGRPDFRAAERTLGVLEDLAGLLAPGGRLLVQTRERDHHAVQAFTRRSYRFFADRELPQRQEAGYPPYGVVVAAEIPPSASDDLRSAAHAGGGVLVGPIRRPRSRLGALIRAPDLQPLLPELAGLVRTHPSARIDVDPVDLP